MSQKTNPISLRLEKKNQNFASPWFTDFFFTENLKDELEIRKYIDSFLEETGNSNAFFSAKSSYRKLNIFLAIQDTRVERKEKQLLFNLKSSLSKINKIARQDNNAESLFISASQNPPLLSRERDKSAYFLRYAKNEEPPLLSQEESRPSLREGRERKRERDLSVERPYKNRNTQMMSVDSSLSRINPSLLSHQDKDDSLAKDTQSGHLFLRKTIISNLLKEKLSYNPSSAPFQFSALQTEQRRTETETKSAYLNDEKDVFLSYLSKIMKDRPYLSYCENLLSKEHAKNRQKRLSKCKNLLLQNPQSKAFPRLGEIDLSSLGFLKIKSSNRFSIGSLSERGKVNIYPIRFIKSSQNVIALLDSVILLLEKRVSFREIKEKIFKDLSKDKMIKGVRITCCGRFGGKSKKAQKAKMQSDIWGQTSLSTFSSKLLFASKSANTSYGKIGIKIWIAFT